MTTNELKSIILTRYESGQDRRVNRKILSLIDKYDELMKEKNKEKKEND